MALVQDGRLYLRTNRADAVGMLTPMQRHGENIISVEHTQRVATTLNGAGLWPAGYEPIHSWAWPRLGVHELRSDQKQTAAWLTINPRGFCLHPPRMGKTASTLAAALFLQEQNVIRRVLVVTVLSAFDDWRRHLLMMRPNAKLHLLHDKGRSALVAGRRIDADFYLMNPAGFRYIHDEVATAIDEGYVDAVVFDELTEFATASAKQSRGAQIATRSAPYVWGLTGTPGDALQMHGQIRLITPQNRHAPESFYHWQNTVARKSGPFRWVVTPAGTALAQQAMTPAIRHRKEDVFPGMSPQIEFVTVPLTAEQQRAIKALKKDKTLHLAGGGIDAKNAGALAQKVLQIAAGAMILDKERIVSYDVTPRIDALEEIIRHKAETKTIIFVQFREVMHMLHDELKKRSIASELMHGDVTLEARADIVRRFTSDAKPDVLILHPTVARYSLELAAADTCVFYGPCTAGAYTYEQARNRILSGRQKSLTPGIVHIQSPGVETLTHRAVIEGRSVQQALAESFLVEIRNDPPTT